jgi:signal transduction histidine kinase
MSWSWRSVLVALEIPVGVVLGLVAAASWNAGVDAVVISSDLAVGWLCIGGGVVVTTARPRSAAGHLLTIVGLTWFAGTIWPTVEFLHRGPLFHLLAGFPSGHVAWRTGGVRTRVVAALVVAGYLMNLTRFGEQIPFSTVYAVALLWLSTDALLMTSGTVRRARLSAAVASLAVGTFMLAEAAARLAGAPFGVGGLYVYDAVLTGAALGLTLDLLLGGWSESALTEAVVELGDAAVAGSVRDRLARSLGDPSLILAFADERTSGAYVDERGRPVVPPAPSAHRIVTPMFMAGRQIGFLAHDATVLEEPRLIDALSAAAGLARANSLLQADVRARVVEVAASRERLVHAADSERRRLERRLSSGVARRLERVAQLLAGVEPAGRPTRAACRDLREELDRARSELADFARGVHPASLTSAGLTGALAELVRRTPLNVELTGSIDPADGLTEATLYFVCSEAIANVAKHADAPSTVVELGQTRDAIRLTIADDGRGGARLMAGGGMRGLADRVEALGGTFELESPQGTGTTLRIGLPRTPAGGA